MGLGHATASGLQPSEGIEEAEVRDRIDQAVVLVLAVGVAVGKAFEDFWRTQQLRVKQMGPSYQGWEILSAKIG